MTYVGQPAKRLWTLRARTLSNTWTMHGSLLALWHPVMFDGLLEEVSELEDEIT